MRSTPGARMSSEASEFVAYASGCERGASFSGSTSMDTTAESSPWYGSTAR